MSGTIGSLLMAVALFVGSHFFLSSLRIRAPLAAALGENGFRALYSVVALAALTWVIAAYRDAPYVELWPVGMGLLHLPVLLMPFASVLAVAGLTSRNVTMVGGESVAREPAPVSGIATITRHPFLWAVTLWAASHILANGDLAGLVLFGGLGILSVGGMLHIDYRRSQILGADWGPVRLSSSAVPFLAAIQGRHRIDWRGIGWLRLFAGLALYAVLPVVHPWIAGSPIMPMYLLDMIR